jgi:hypothetical protein
MRSSLPPRPPELACRIACDAAGKIEIDLAPLRAIVTKRLEASTGRRDWIEAETFALEALDELWDGELRERCALALADVHEAYLVQAVRVHEAMQTLAAEGRHAWIATGVLHEFANQLAFGVLGGEGLLELET